MKECIPSAFTDDNELDDYFNIKDNEYLIDFFIYKMSNGDPTKYNQIAKENTLCDYIKWQTLKLRDCAIEKELMKQFNDSDDNTPSNPNKKLLSRNEFLALVNSGGFKTD